MFWFSLLGCLSFINQIRFLEECFLIMTSRSVLFSLLYCYCSIVLKFFDILKKIFKHFLLVCLVARWLLALTFKFFGVSHLTGLIHDLSQDCWNMLPICYV